MSLPLTGRTVLVTRPSHQADDLIRPLEALGARTIAMAAIQIQPPDDWQPLDEALGKLERYDWVVFTSANGVEFVRRRMETLNLAPDDLSSRRLAVVGPATATALADFVRAPDLIPNQHVAEAVADALGDVSGRRFLFPRADRARRELVTALRSRGAEVDDVVAYRIVRAPTDQELPDQAPDAITVTSSESARATSEALAARGRGHWMAQSAIVCIGPVTAATVRELGYEPAAVAKEYTIAGLVAAVAAHFEEMPNHA